MAGLALFTAASLLCGLAQSQEMLVGARFIQGVGGAMTSAVILGMIVTMFPEPREQAKAIGVYAFVASGGGSVGLLAGGVLTEAINWHWIFFINVPIAIVTAVLAVRLIERDEGIGFGGGTDVPGAVLITSSLMLGVYTIVKPAAENGWGDPQTLLLSGISPRSWRRSSAREATAKNPLIPLGIFRSRNITGANVDPGAQHLGHVRDVLPGHALPASGSSATTRSRSASRSCPPRSRWGSCRRATPSGSSCASARAAR